MAGAAPNHRLLAITAKVIAFIVLCISPPKRRRSMPQSPLGQNIADDRSHSLTLLV
ncbi:hypothetical protein C4K29_5685 [Pseudomonas chlororaphis subsp. piscium]|nr:hypothetical protein C4K29_5685 [Pseudomonas chlororaphis subsp. piscium]